MPIAVAWPKVCRPSIRCALQRQVWRGEVKAPSCLHRYLATTESTCLQTLLPPPQRTALVAGFFLGAAYCCLLSQCCGNSLLDSLRHTTVSVTWHMNLMSRRAKAHTKTVILTRARVRAPLPASPSAGDAQSGQSHALPSPRIFVMSPFSAFGGPFYPLV